MSGTLKHTPYCDLRSAVRPGAGCCCGANERIREALAAGEIKPEQVAETCGGEFEDVDD